MQRSSALLPWRRSPTDCEHAERDEEGEERKLAEHPPDECVGGLSLARALEMVEQRVECEVARSVE